MGASLSTAGRRCKRRRKKRSERKGSVLIAVLSKLSTRGQVINENMQRFSSEV